MPAPISASLRALGHGDASAVSAEPPMRAQVDVDHRGARRAQRRGDARRRRELDGVALAVAEAERVAAPPRGARHRQRRRRVEPARQKHDRVARVTHLRARLTRECARGREPRARSSTSRTPRSTTGSTGAGATTCASTARWPPSAAGRCSTSAAAPAACMVPLLRDGHTVVGLDHAPAMLARAAARDRAPVAARRGARAAGARRPARASPCARRASRSPWPRSTACSTW